MGLRIMEDELVTLEAKTGAASSVVTPSVTPKKNKYNAKKKEVDGITFHSTAEARRYQELKLLADAGEIINLQLQVRHPLYVLDKIVATYIADFLYYKDGYAVVEDVKGVKTDVYKLKKKMFEAYYGAKITEIARRK